MCSVDLDGRCEVWDERPVVARKAHECNGCGTVIHPGEAYLKHFSIYEKDISPEKECFPCWATRDAFREAHGAIYPPSGFMQLLEDCVVEGDDESEWRPGLAAMKRRWRTSRSGRRHLERQWIYERLRQLRVAAYTPWIFDAGRSPPSSEGGGR